MRKAIRLAILSWLVGKLGHDMCININVQP